VKREEVHRSWAPEEGPWSAWVKPVLFAHLDEEVAPQPLAPPPSWLRRGVIAPLIDAGPRGDDPHAHPYRGEARLRDTALVIDLPGDVGAAVGIALVDFGFRPIPLYNAIPAPDALINLQSVMRLLVDAAARVATVAPAAPPAFLLDANRARFGDSVRPGVFDNRSICHDSDFPSPQTLSKGGICRALVIQETSDRPGFDLESVLFSWQRHGIALWRKQTNVETPAAPFVLRRRSWLSRLIHDVRSEFLPQRADRTYGRLVRAPGGS
jgi:hypothetical protein